MKTPLAFMPINTSLSRPRRFCPKLSLLVLLAALAAINESSTRAADVYWETGSTGNWSNSENWQGGVLPTDVDNAIFGSGTVTIDTIANTYTASIGNAVSDVTHITIASGGLWMPNGSDMAVPSGTIWIGKSGTGFVVVESGGIWRSSASNANGDFLRLGENNGSYGKITVEGGGLWESGGIFVGGSGGTGIVHIEAGGTLAQRNGTLYVGRYDNSYGEVIVDGYYISGGNGANAQGTYYVPVGYTAGATGVFSVGSSGTVISAGIDIAKHATATGTVTIAGYWEAKGNNPIGNLGNGTLIIETGGYMATTGHVWVGANVTGTGYLEVKQGGVLEFTTTRDLLIGGTFASATTTTGTAIISGTIMNANTVYIGNHAPTDNTLIINEGGYFSNNANSWFGRNVNATGLSTAIVDGYWHTGGYLRVAERGTSVLSIGQSGTVSVIGYSYLGTNAGSSGTAFVDGLWKMDGTFHIGQAAGHGHLYIGQTGTVSIGATGLRVTYSHPESTAYVDIDGLLDATGYIIVAHYGDSYMRVGATGTAQASSYISIGQGDYSGSLIDSGSYYATMSGTVDVFGYMAATTYIRVANRLTGVLNIESSGTVKSTTYFYVADNNSVASSGTVNVYGRLDIGTNLTLGTNPINTGNLNLFTSSSVTVGGVYTQNSLSTLDVETNTTRARDMLYPELTSPLITIGGRAILSGTLIAHGDAIPGLEYTGDGEGHASDLAGIPVLRAAGGIAGDFDLVKVDGLVIPANLPDFIRGGGMKVYEGGAMPTRYDIGFGLAWNSSTELNGAHGSFTIEENKTFNVDVQLANRTGLVFASGWDGKSLTKMGKGTLVISALNTYNGTTTVQSGTLRYEGPPSHTLGALVNNSVVDFGAGGQRTITAASLTSSLVSSGTFLMSLDLTAGTSDRLTITGDAIGNYRFVITDAASNPSPSGDEADITLLSIGGVNDITADYEITIAGTTLPGGLGTFDYGVFKYEAKMQGNNLVIVNTGMDPGVFSILEGVPGAQSLLWFDQQDNLNRRFGELRSQRESGAGFDLWARGHAASATIGGGSSEVRRFDVDIWGAEIGADYTWELDSDRVTVGAFLGYSIGDQDFRLGTATGESNLFSIGAYAAWFAESGWFANATLTASHYDNKFAITVANGSASGDYKDRGFGVTVEVGHRFDVTKGWFIEPAVQGAATRLIRDNYMTGGDSQASGLSVHGADATITRVRGIIRIGRAWSLGKGQWMEIAGRAGALRERSSGGVVNIGTANRWRPNLDGERYEAGVGVFWKPFEKGQLYFDYEYASGDNYEKPWGISLGFRLSL